MCCSPNWCVLSYSAVERRQREFGGAVAVANLIDMVMLCRSVSLQRCRVERMVINKRV